MSEKVRARNIDVLAIGETLVDLISIQSAGSLEGAAEFGRYLGGSVTNMAVNVARLGGRAAVISRLGDDPLGRFLLRTMKAHGVMTEYVRLDAEARTPLAFITRTKSTADFLIYRDSDTRLSPEDAPLDAIERARAVHTSAFALAYEPARSTILRALRHARAMGCLVSLDPNYHPRIWPRDEDAIAVLEEAFRFVDVTKPSIEDCARLWGPGQSPDDYIERFLGWGAKVVALTMGATGVLLALAGGRRYRILPGAVMAVDTTGAGDAFWAGLLTGLLDGHPPERAACLGQVVAEIKIGRVGHLPPTLERADLYRRLDEKRCEPA